MMGVPARLSEIERKGRLERFKNWLVANGSEILAPTNEWEVLRFRGDRGTAIIYRNAAGRLNWQNGSDRAYRAWKNEKPWRAQPKTRRTSGGANSIPVWPPIPCPDCNGMLRLEPMPPNWDNSGHRPWIYLCDQRHETRCRGKLTAHPDGSPAGKPVTQAVRTARRQCHAVFDPLWQHAWHLYEIKERNATERARAVRRIQRSARLRAYAYMAERLGMAEEDCHIGHITDVETLRLFYAEAQKATPEIIRAWAKQRDDETSLRGAPPAEKDAPPCEP